MTTTAAPTRCAVCGARRGGSPCVECAHNAAPWIATVSAWRDRVAPATGAEVAISVLVDGSLCLAAILAGLFGGGAWGLNVLGRVALAVVVGSVALALLLRGLVGTGRTPGTALTSVRILATPTGYPPRLAEVFGPTTRVSTRRGPDPLTPPPPEQKRPSAASPRPAVRPGSRGVTSWSVLQPGRPASPVGARAIIGRYATAEPNEAGTTRIDVYDLTRTVSRSHLVLQPDPATGVLWATDLGSVNGSRLQLDGPHAYRPLPAYQPVAVPPGSVLYCGDQPIVVVAEGGAP